MIFGGFNMDKRDKKIKEGDRAFSWQVVNEGCVIKTIDKSFIEYGEAQVPMEMKWFFNVEELKYKEELKIQILYKNSFYNVAITVDKTNRAKMRCSSVLSSLIKELKYISYDGDSYAVFKKDRLNYYELKIYKEL